jgi:hypothetical protein
MKYAIIQVDGKPQVAYVCESQEDIDNLFKQFTEPKLRHTDPSVVHSELSALCRCGERIQAIKLVRTLTGWGLKDSKHYVDLNWPRTSW